jgi:hypothetical protein
MDHAKATAGKLHWVRYRRLVRTKIFDPSQFVPENVAKQCDHCDSKATESLSTLLLEAMAYLTMLESPSQLTDAVALPIKQQLLEKVHPTNNVNLPGDSALSRLDNLHKLVEMHCNEARNAPKHVFSLMGMYYERRKDSGFVKRYHDISQNILTPGERDTISRLLVRAYDPEFQLHCSKENCGDACEFARVPCPNLGCNATMSKLYLPAHNPVCPYKLVKCECGDEFPQHQQQQHLHEVCPLREEKCPFVALGCAKVTQAKDLPNHVAQETGSHLLLTLNRLTEVQDVIRGLNSKIQHLEEENVQLRKTLDAYRDAGIKEAQALDKKVGVLGNKVATMENANRKEFRKIHKAEQQREHVK